MSLGKGIKFLHCLFSVSHAVPFADFSEKEWGGSDVFRRFYQGLNSHWRECRGHDLFDVVGEVTRGVDGRDNRKFKVVDPDILALRMMGQPLMPAFLEFLPTLKGTVLEQQLETVFRQRYGEQVTNDTFRTNLHKKFYYFGRGMRDYSAKSAVLEATYNALLLEKMLRVKRYSASAKKIVKDDLKPRTLVLFNSGLYLLAVSKNDSSDTVKKYLIDNFQEAQCLDNHPAPYPTEYSPAEIFDEGFGFMQGSEKTEVVLEIQDGWAMDYVRSRVWTKNDQYTQLDGRTYMRFETTDLREVVKWILGFEDQVKVIEPEQLKDSILDVTRRISSVYMKKSS